MSWKEYTQLFHKPFRNNIISKDMYIIDDNYVEKYCKSNNMRMIGAQISSHLETLKVKSCILKLKNYNHNELIDVLSGFYLKHFRFTRYKSYSEYINIIIHHHDATILNNLWKDMQFSLESVLWARTLICTPANHMTPLIFSNEVQKELRNYGYSIEILDPLPQMELFKSVSLGSPNPPKMIKIYKGKPEIAFIGKGVTFDTGGISLKPANNMHEMIADMSGAAAVVASARSLHNKVNNVMFLCGLVENSIDGKAQRPGDIWKSMNGKTVEVLNTDAEGRLVLGDLAYYANTLGCRQVITIATLTGAMMVALGNLYAGFFTSSSNLHYLLKTGSKNSKENGWFLPFTQEYDQYLTSKVADIQNIPNKPGASSIMGGKFVETLTKSGTEFAHIDMANMSTDTRLSSVQYSGFGVLLLEHIALAIKDLKTTKNISFHRTHNVKMSNFHYKID